MQVNNIPVELLETAQQLTHATGCSVQYLDTRFDQDARLSATPVAAVRGRMTLHATPLTALKGSAIELVREQDNVLYVRPRR